MLLKEPAKLPGCSRPFAADMEIFYACLGKQEIQACVFKLGLLDG